MTGEEAENGLQRTVRQSSRSETVKDTEYIRERVSKLYQNEQVDLSNIYFGKLGC